MNLNRLKRISEELDTILSEPAVAEPAFLEPVDQVEYVTDAAEPEAIEDSEEVETLEELPVMDSTNPNEFQQLADKINDIDPVDYDKLVNETIERFIVVTPEGIQIRQGEKIEAKVDTANLHNKELDDANIREIAKDYFDNITDDIRVAYL